MKDYKLQILKRKLNVFFLSFLSSFLFLAPATKEEIANLPKWQLPSGIQE
jgi:hypothetical protein